jgi:predicted RND superfamily exporter protein
MLEKLAGQPTYRRLARTLRAQLARLLILPGIYGARMPRQALAAVALVSIVMAAGALSLRTDDALGSLLRSNVQVYRDYEAFKARFPGNEFDIQVAVGWTGDLDPIKLEAIRDIHLELQLIESVSSVLSIFSLRSPAEGNALPPTIIPETLPEGAEFASLIDAVKSHPLARGRLLSTPHTDEPIALLVVHLKRGFIAREGLPAVVQRVESTAQSMAKDGGFTVGITGIPVMKAEIIAASQRDRVVFPALGFLVGALVCAYFFRDWRYVAICMLPSSLAVLWAIGLFGILGLELDPVKNAILPLVMVVALTDTLHLATASRAGLRAGLGLEAAALRAVDESGTANALTAATTAISFLSMNITDSDLISSFGTAAAIATAFGYLLVISMVPGLFVLLAREECRDAKGDIAETAGQKAIDRICAALADFVILKHKAIAAAGMISLLVLGFLHLQVPPYYRLSDLVPQNQQAASVAHRLEKHLGGIYPISVMISWAPGPDIGSDRVAAAIRVVHDAVTKTKGVTNVASPETLRRWLSDARPGSGDAPREATAADVKAFLAKIPADLSRRFIDVSGNGALVTGYIGDLQASEVMVIAEDLDARLEPLRAANPDMTFTISDLSVMAASRSLSIITQLNYSLLSTIFVDLPTIGLAFGSLLVVGYSAIANIFALAAMGALIFAFGSGLEYSSVIALTVTFGLTADSTIHLLNRMRLERERGVPESEVVGRSIRHVGSVLLMSTVILVLGLSVSQASVVPPTQLFGKISALTLILALPGLLVVMPAVALWAAGVKKRVIGV